LVGGAGNDSLRGGAGIDTASYASSVLPVRASLTTGLAIGEGRDELIGIENLVGGHGDDTLVGDAGRNRLTGGDGNDLLQGRDGNDVLVGGAGDDTLSGGAGNDTASYGASLVGIQANLETGQATGEGTDLLSSIENLEGGAGNDVFVGNRFANKLTGGGGKDTLTGGLGADRFIYASADATGKDAGSWDIITDFSRSQHDKLDVSAWDADTSQAGMQHWSFQTKGFDGRAGQITFDPATHLVSFDADGDLVADFQIELVGVTTLSAANFVL
jgi:Ca2+-binding RTX toxin-like protein